MNAIGRLDKVNSWLQAHHDLEALRPLKWIKVALCAEQEKLEQVRVVCIPH